MGSAVTHRRAATIIFSLLLPVNSEITPPKSGPMMFPIFMMEVSNPVTVAFRTSCSVTCRRAPT